jgi:YidC/Oxa1 family membrane protein insertase
MSQQLGPDGKQSFLDRGTIVALILIGVFWFAWSSWVEKKYPSRPAVAAQEQTEEVATSGAVQGATASGAVIGGDKPAQASSGQAVGAKSLPEKQVRVETNEWVAFLSSHGLGLSTVDLKNYKTRDEQPILVGATAAGLFTTKLVGETAPIAFEIIEESGVSGSVSGAQSF